MSQDATPDPHEQPAWEEVPPKPADLDDHPEISARNARNGLILFAIYFALYAGFMALSTFKPSVMALTFAGVNLAIWYGMGLILAAFVLALIYMYLARANRNGAPGGGGVSK